MNAISTSPYDGLVAVMERYLSHTSVESTMQVVLGRRGIAAQELDPRDAAPVVAEAMVGLRIFCDPDRLPDLMLDLADYCEQVAEEDPVPKATPLAIRSSLAG